MTSVDRICVQGADPYDVLIGRGLTGEVGNAIAGASRVLVVHQPTVAAIAVSVADALPTDIDVTLVELPDGEAAKTADVLAQMWARLGQLGFTRNDAVVAVGGGSATDFAGFVAASWLRGIRVVHYSTTIAGMVDAAVGGKTGINTGEGKNLVGAFHPPAGVMCDLDALDLLPPHEFLPGMAEVVKCGFIADPVILERIEADPVATLNPSHPVVHELIARSVQVKADVVGADLKESGLREILNYGHTLGHAIEHAHRYTWRHGNAVSIGLVFAAELAHAVGRLSGDVVQRHRSVLTSLGLPTSYSERSFEELLTAMRRDKKARGNVLRFVVLDDIAAPGRLEGPDENLLAQAFARLA